MNGKRNYAGGFWSEVKTMMMIDGVIGICDGGEKQSPLCFFRIFLFTICIFAISFLFVVFCFVHPVFLSLDGAPPGIVCNTDERELE